jgi:hypothetical protein
MLKNKEITSKGKRRETADFNSKIFLFQKHHLLCQHRHDQIMIRRFMTQYPGMRKQWTFRGNILTLVNHLVRCRCRPTHLCIIIFLVALHYFSVGDLICPQMAPFHGFGCGRQVRWSIVDPLYTNVKWFCQDFKRAGISRLLISAICVVQGKTWKTDRISLLLGSIKCFPISFKDLVTPNISACRKIHNTLLIKALFVCFNTH